MLVEVLLIPVHKEPKSLGLRHLRKSANLVSFPLSYLHHEFGVLPVHLFLESSLDYQLCQQVISYLTVLWVLTVSTCQSSKKFICGISPAHPGSYIIDRTLILVEGAWTSRNAHSTVLSWPCLGLFLELLIA